MKQVFFHVVLTILCVTFIVTSVISCQNVDPQSDQFIKPRPTQGESQSPSATPDSVKKNKPTATPTQTVTPDGTSGNTVTPTPTGPTSSNDKPTPTGTTDPDSTPTAAEPTATGTTGPINTPTGTAGPTMMPTPTHSGQITPTATGTQARTPHPEMVIDLSPSHYEHAGQIELAWTTLKGVDSYKIYRYESCNTDTAASKVIEVTDLNPGTIDILTTVDSPENGSSDYDKPFFYRIASVTGGVEGALSGFTHGICGSQIDSHEPGNDTRAPDNAGSSVFAASDPAMVLYALPDGNGSVVTDVDWYKIKSLRESVTITIKPDQAGSVNIDEGDIRLEFYYGADTKVTFYVKPWINTYTFNDFNNEADNGELVDVHYRLVFAKTDVTKNKIFRYTINY